MPNKKVFIKTQGCQMNEYDSAQMVNLLHSEKGMERTEIIEEADIVLINTCSIREKAQEKVFSDLGRWRELKKKNPSIMIGVGGCVASQEGEAIIKRAPYVDLVFGPQTLHRLPDMIEQVDKTGRPAVDITFPEIEKFDRLPEPQLNGPSALVSIMEGCSKYCSYCVVPYTRGEEISRPFDQVLAEVASLAEKGAKEITFLGQNVNDYRGKMHNGELADLALLIEYTAELEGIERIRFTTSHPLAFSDRLIAAYGTIPKLANHLHLPVQSGSNKILQAMKRGYTREEFIAKINKLKAVRPDITIGSDFIVGFPGETAQDFEDTISLVGEIDFDHSFSFIYSPRPGTPAVKLHNNTTEDEKKERLKILQDRLAVLQHAHSEKMLGTVQRVLVEGTSKKRDHELKGRTENYRVVNFAGSADLIGQFVDLKIVDIQPNSLRGEIVNGQHLSAAPAA
jgi:tRNA-2-methylthio-N6-dimethylallyladenosine synthase